MMEVVSCWPLVRWGEEGGGGGVRERAWQDSGQCDFAVEESIDRHDIF